MPAPRSFVGGLNVPSREGAGRMSATMPLAVLEVDDEAVTLRTRRFLPGFTGPYRVPLREIAVAHPVQRRPLRRGIGLTATDGRTAYFWTTSSEDRVLRELAVRGVAIDPEPRPVTFRAVSRSAAPPAGTSSGAPLQRWMVWWLPLAMVVGTGYAAVLITRPSPWFFKVWTGVVWVSATLIAYRLWRSIRSSG